MLKAFLNCFKIPSLRTKILVTLGIIGLCRLLANVPCPGIDPKALDQLFTSLQQNQDFGGLVEVFNLFTGGALQRFAVASLGIMPYITASIILSLLTPIWEPLAKLKREGEAGFQKLNQYTRYLTLAICLIQGWVLAVNMGNGFGMASGDLAIVPNNGLGFRLTTVIILTAGTMMLVWLGDQITDFGIGNGASLIITIGIVEGLPAALVAVYDSVMASGTGGETFTIIHVIILLALFVAVTAATVMLTVGVRNIPIEHARTRNTRASGGARSSSSFPLRVNYANVMPIIFAGPVLMIPPMLLRWLSQWYDWPGYAMRWFDYGSLSYMFMMGGLIILFAFFWVASQFNPIQIADDLKRSGAYIPGVRPGKPTADFLDYSMTRITTAGSVFLAALALFPMIFTTTLPGVSPLMAQFFGGTSLLIIVGVLLDTMRQIESQLVMHAGYETFTKGGHLRSRLRRAY